MKDIFHKIRKRRSFSSQERWLIVAAFVILTIAVSSSNWLLWGKPAASASSITIDQLLLDKATISADGQDSAKLTLNLVNKATQTPAANLWIGLIIPQYWQRSEQLTQNGWYAADGKQSFYETNAAGEVSFDIKSDLAGKIEYAIYVLNPDLKNESKYQKLDGAFDINFE